MNIYSGDDGAAETRIWVARRSAAKQTWPDHLDQCVAGGLASGEDVARCAARECMEEASIDLERDTVVPALRPVGVISYARLDDAAGEFFKIFL